MNNGIAWHMESANDPKAGQPSHMGSERLLQTAKFLSIAKTSLLEDLNVDNLNPESSGRAEGEPNSKALKSTHQEKPLKLLSKASRTRADRVRSYIQFYYHLLEKEVTNHGSGEYRGVEGTYNPLQVIRNRKIKKKLHDSSRNEIAFMQPPILAIRDFSTSPGKDFVWFVGVNETTSDLAWRVSHWDELRRPDGKRWFKNNSKKRSRSATETTRMYRGERPPTHSRHSSSILVRRASASWELPIISVESIDDQSEKTTRNRESKFEKALERTKRISRTALQNKSSSQQQVNEVNVKPLNSSQRLYATPTEPFNHVNLADIPIHSTKNQIMEEDNSLRSLKQGSSDFLEVEKEDQVPEGSLLQTQFNELRYLRCTWRVMKIRKQTAQIIQARSTARASTIVVEDPSEVSKPAADTLSEYDNELIAALKTCDIWKSRLLNDYSIRVETLISISDRVLSDINSTLTLRLKMLQEKVDKFGTLKRMNKEPLRIFLYRVLEVAIVVLFWMIWFVFTVIKTGKIILLSLLNIARRLSW